ncbi:unnamed protein product [Cuscuta campestris]|uniref:Uncharacterized protein n=1 Tax=Cuscuta campestris TaxID=132261 RepID=A0A484NDH6_9ASTE|nr:unnamed protein product [Cuscuta campestris]
MVRGSSGKVMDVNILKVVEEGVIDKGSVQPSPDSPQGPNPSPWALMVFSGGVVQDYCHVAVGVGFEELVGLRSGRGGRFGLREGVEWVEGRELFSEVEGRVGWGMAMECVGAEGKEMAVDGLALVGLGIFGAWVVPGDALALLAEFGDFFIDGSEEKRLVTVLNNKFVDLWLRNINFNTNSC